MNNYDEETLKAHERSAGRRAKMEAQSALNRKMIVNTAGFNAAWKSWRKKRQHVQALREGYIEPQEHFELDWDKVWYTGGCQIMNLFLTTSCVLRGSYIMALVTFASLIVFNLILLVSDKG